MATVVPPPPEVLVEFLRALAQLVTESQEDLMPVLRGSLILRHWYGDRARLPADIDIECFIQSGAHAAGNQNYLYPPGTDEQFYGPSEGRFGRHGEYASRVDLGKALCRYAADSSAYQPGRGDFVFRDDENPPADGASLWVYGTPGKRYYTIWEWNGDTGRLQLDLSTPGPYTPDDLAVAEETFVSPGDDTFTTRVYSREAMLAAKVSWLVRGLGRADGGEVAWTGEPKDLFDAHLLATDTALRPDVFRRAMLAVGTADALNWNALDVLFDVRRTDVTDDAFGNWPDFARRHPTLAPAGPTALWAELADRLEPLFGDLYPVAEMPFLAAVNADPDDKLALLVYADWLDDRADPRGPLVRAVGEMLFSNIGDYDPRARRAVAEGLNPISQPWLHQLFGTSARLQAFRAAVDVP